MSERINSLKIEMAAKCDQKSIDFGYCIPDCGRCCLGKGKELEHEEVERIASHLSIPREEFVASAVSSADAPSRYYIRTEEERCIFLFGHSLCLIYNHRPKVCRKYGDWTSDCMDFRRIKELSETGSDIRKKLKELWLMEMERGNYDRVKWKVRAELLVGEMVISRRVKFL